MSKIEVDTIAPQSGTTVTLGESGDSINVTPGAIKDSSGNVIISKSGTTVTLGASGDTVSVASGAEFVGGGIQWQSDIKTSAFTAVAGEGYWVNTTSGAITITLPASASVGDQIIFTDYARTWGTNAVTVNQNSLNYQGYTSPNPVYNTNGQSVNIVYSGATQGWIPNSDDDVSFETSQTYSADFLVIAGGGGAGYDRGGGGGAGGYRNSYSTEPSGGGGSSETSLALTPGTVYTITVGDGGSGAVSGTGAASGNDSSISGSDITDITSIGGGAGGGNGPDSGLAGGSGGGRAYAGTPGSGTANQGFSGGASSYPGAPSYAAAGGGGAGEAGDTDGNKQGGDGLSSSITGSAVTRGGGGGGFADSGGGGAPGGDGGGGAASSTNGANDQQPGTANTGGGGGGGDGGGPGNGASGGSGVVILRMATADYSGTTTGSPTVGTSGSDTILTFTGSGSYTA